MSGSDPVVRQSVTGSTVRQSRIVAQLSAREQVGESAEVPKTKEMGPCKKKLYEWEANPLFTPRYVVYCLGLYTLVFSILGAAFFSASLGTQIISIEYLSSPSMDCGGTGIVTPTIAGVVSGAAKIVDRKCSRFKSGAGTDSAQEYTSVEEFTIEMQEDMEGPFMV